MELEWEQKRKSPHTAAVLAGAVLGAALGADCFLAVDQLAGAPAVLCGGLAALWAVRGGTLFAGRRSRTGVLLALAPVVLWMCLANHLRSALSAAPGDPEAIWTAFVGLEALTSPDSFLGYWLPLAGLAGTALAVWIILFLRAGREKELLERAVRPCRTVHDPPPADMEIFQPNQSWIRPFRLQRGIVRGIWLAVFFLCGWLGALFGAEEIWSRMLGGMGFGLVFIPLVLGPSGRICAAGNVLYARRDGVLWRMPMSLVLDPELRVSLSKLAQIWDQLPRERQAALKASAAALIDGGSSAAASIKAPRLVWQSKWEWAVSGSFGGKIIIPKVYPGFTPVPGGAEQLKERLPLRWLNTVCTLAITAACLTIGFFLGWVDMEEAYHQSLMPPEPPAEEAFLPEPAVPDVVPEAVTAARVPEEIGSYYLNGLILQTDNAFQATSSELWDQENDVHYEISLQYGVGEEAALYMLEKTEAEQVRYLRDDGGDFLWMLGENSVVYRYNLRTAQLSDGQTLHTGAALSERGTLLVIECRHGRSTEEAAVRGDLLYMLENLQFTGPAITEENYQEQLRPAVSMGFTYCGQAFLKAPEGMFDYNVFLDTFMPCGGEVKYFDDGISMMTTVHGLRVSAAVVPCDGTAMDVVDRAYQALKSAGRQYDEQNMLEDAYNEEGNNACRVAVYYDGGRTRVTVLVARGKWDGYYLFKELTCLPEEVDGEYEALFKEMEATCGIEVSVMETLGRSSRS